MDVQFDPAKNDLNLAQHGVALAFGAEIFADSEHLLLSSVRSIDGEERHKVIGMVDGKLFTAVHVYRDDAVRFISVRRSNDGEAALYYTA